MKKTIKSVSIHQPSLGERVLANHLKIKNIPFETEYQFFEERKWRADFWIVESNVLVEVEGGVFSKGRHTRGGGYVADMEKYNEAQKLGFVVLRYSTEQVTSGHAINDIAAYLEDQGFIYG